MRKFFLSLIFLLFVFPYSFSSASFLDNNSNYQIIQSTQTHTFYIDIASARNIRYAPPYYTIEGNIISQDFSRGTISSFTYRFMYDLNNFSIQARPIAVNSYDDNGELLFTASEYDMQQYDTTQAPKGSPLEIAANSYFKHFYNASFSESAISKHIDRIMNGEII